MHEGHAPCLLERGERMDGLSEFFLDLKRRGSASGNFLGLLRLLIGHKIVAPSGVVVSQGMTWRQAADILKKARWDKEAVRELGLDPDALAPRDRHRYWYQAIQVADLGSPAALDAGNRLASQLRQIGYQVS